MIDKYELQDNKWLEKIFYSYKCQNFCVGMSITQSSETMNKFFKKFLNSSTPPNKFVIQYEKTFDARYNMERDKTFKIVNSKPLMQTCYAMEEKASKFYMRIVQNISRRIDCLSVVCCKQD